jgi:hypothetical protein
MKRAAAHFQRMVAGSSKVSYRIQQGSVQIEYYQSCHKFDIVLEIQI